MQLYNKGHLYHFRLERIFSEQKRKRWIDVISDVEYSLNNTYSSVLGATPASVTEQNSGEIWQRMFDKTVRNYDSVPPATLSIGSHVRIAKEKRIFRKGKSFA